ncbi:NHLP bacteriocin export ABC transporter permease/ATPase subunit [Oleisolibacter albus]|uniref:NHLP bacteriocin export ABC transporter permease/ATPase subunit n=1 Tax=Oleisolibacter albus TaxID=2171757 RepID=UPI000DF1B7CE|nr:NHLP bacteriocin export ABC transporter permease/ATPase subunit [Oleisolibacter albus]
MTTLETAAETSRTGPLFEGGYRHPLVLDGAGDGYWRVEDGFFDLFAVERDGAGRDGRRHHLFRVPQGGVLLDVAPAAGLHLLAVGSLGSRARRCGAAPDAAAAEAWIVRLAQAAALEMPWSERVAEPGAQILPAGATLAADARRVLWLRVERGTADLLGFHPVAAGAPPLPLVDRLWLTAPEETTLVLEPTGAVPPPLARFHAFVLEAVAERLRRQARAGEAVAGQRARDEADALSRGLGRLAGALDGRDHSPAVETGEPLTTAIARILLHLGEPMPALTAAPPPGTGVDETFAQMGLRRRRVLLRPGWERSAADALLAFLDEEKRPVALLPAGKGWRVAGLGLDAPLDADLAARLQPEAWQLYRSFPADPLRFRDLMRLGARGNGRDLLRLALAGAAAALVGLAVPKGMQIAFDSLVPNGEVPALLALMAGLVAAAIGQGAFELVRGLALQRLEARFEINAAPALMDRLLRLPARFFRGFTAGDLADRLLGIQNARAILGSNVTGGLVGAVFGLVGFGLLLSYDGRLALVALVLSLATTAVIVGTSLAELRHERERIRHQGRLDGFVLQLIMGIGKLRTAAAEKRAMAEWARRYAHQRDRFVAGRRWAAVEQTVMAFLPTLCTAVLFGALAYFLKADLTAAATSGNVAAGEARQAMTTGAFVAFSAAFGQLMAAIVGLGKASSGLTMALPLIERAKPLLEAVPEGTAESEPPGLLQGGVALRQVRFRYGSDSPAVLDGLDLEIEPGQFVALVGPSGSGKSTILRLLLGFDRPETGEVLFDGRTASRLDMAAVRRQIGVVLQNGRISAGSLSSNILGPSGLRLEDAWAAARMVGLDRDIEEMPMGMHTVLMEGGGTLSGGQRQRLLIARALVHRPRLLLLDEATSALDNRTQAIVTETLSKLSVTRIVIAHRLSTIQGVDRIFVIEKGRLVQSGRYEALIDSPGPFATLAQRQLVQ